MANKDPDALLDPTQLKAFAEKTFTTFFQYFASSPVSVETGGWAFQKINESLPAGLGTAVKMNNNSVLTNKTAAKQDTIHPTSHTNRTAEATFARRVEVLKMNAAAVWLSTSIMSWLVLTIILFAGFQQRYFGTLVRGVGCLGNVLVLIIDSQSLLHVVRGIQQQRASLQPRDYDEHLRTRLGWFVDTAGKIRWGIEMDDGPHGNGPGPRVQWVEKLPHFSKETAGVGEWILSDDGDDDESAA